MKTRNKAFLLAGIGLIVLFVIFTILIKTVDVQVVGPKDKSVGFAAINTNFHSLTGENMVLYTITDWLGLVPIAICIVFGILGLVQLIKRRSLFKVDIDILFLGIYYILVILGYLIFEMIPFNYRPILIGGHLEASYPSSTTLLVLSVMPTLFFETHLRVEKKCLRYVIYAFTVLFSLFMVIGRTISGVHWLTDIVGSIILSGGLFITYLGVVLIFQRTSDNH